MWTDSLAVGDRNFVEDMKKRIPRIRTYTTEEKTSEEAEIWSIKETKDAYT